MALNASEMKLFDKVVKALPLGLAHGRRQYWREVFEELLDHKHHRELQEIADFPANPNPARSANTWYAIPGGYNKLIELDACYVYAEIEMDDDATESSSDGNATVSGLVPIQPIATHSIGAVDPIAATQGSYQNAVHLRLSYPRSAVWQGGSSSFYYARTAGGDLLWAVEKPTLVRNRLTFFGDVS